MVSPLRVVNNVSPLGVVDVVSPLSVVEMLYCQTPSGCVVFPSGVVGGGPKIRAHHPWELNAVIVRLVILSHLGGWVVDL